MSKPSIKNNGPAARDGPNLTALLEDLLVVVDLLVWSSGLPWEDHSTLVMPSFLANICADR